MINKIELCNFKCFAELSLPISSLNIFTGLNGMGKSTVIQSLLLLKQAEEQGFPIKQVFLNGNYVSLGTGKDVLFENATHESIRIQYSDGSAITELELEYEANSDVLKLTSPIEALPDTFYSNFEYINAERLSPKTIYEKSSLSVNNNQLGIYGQYTVHYLSEHEGDSVDVQSGDEYKTLKEGVQYWLNEISPNIRINLSQIENADLAQINYYYTGLSDSTRTREYRPTNVGFGISYILPIVTALLKAKKGSILIIENPEAHLHPRGQRKIGELIALCASKGVQVFLETHSDHVLNGIRISVKKAVLPPSSVSVNFFTSNRTASHCVEHPIILENGRLNYWPDGFFDEWERALDEIL